MIIESEKVIVSASRETVFSYVSDMNNIINLLPQDKVSEWKSTSDDCSFKVQNTAIISLVKESVEAPSKLLMKSGEKSPFPFTLTISIVEMENGECEGFLVFDGKVNAFLKMMVEKPLTNLFNYMSTKLKEIHA
ncbi:MAG: hypothetical protein KDC84_01865 [Crocinitomicaceae bacterium]|nr:hypothetical protein [Crocinitomicaceae bacterium]